MNTILLILLAMVVYSYFENQEEITPAEMARRQQEQDKLDVLIG